MKAHYQCLDLIQPVISNTRTVNGNNLIAVIFFTAISGFHSSAIALHDVHVLFGYLLRTVL